MTKIFSTTEKTSLNTKQSALSETELDLVVGGGGNTNPLDNPQHFLPGLPGPRNPRQQ